MLCHCLEDTALQGTLLGYRPPAWSPRRAVERREHQRGYPRLFNHHFQPTPQEQTARRLYGNQAPKKRVSLATTEHTVRGQRSGWVGAWGNSHCPRRRHSTSWLVTSWSRDVGFHALSHLVDGGCQIRQGSHLQPQGHKLGTADSSSSSQLTLQPLRLSPAVPELYEQLEAVGDLLVSLGRPLVGCTQHPEGPWGRTRRELSRPGPPRPGDGEAAGAGLRRGSASRAPEQPSSPKGFAPLILSNWSFLL